MNDFIKILIVEDNDMTREMMTNVLWTKGYTVFQASDGAEGLNVLDDNDIHLIIADIHMSPMDGLEFVKKLLIDKVKIPTILVTSEPSSDLLARAVELGVQKVLQKPVAPNRLLMAVDRILERLNLSPSILAVEAHEETNTHKELMKKAIELAANNVRTKKGRPFGAVIADKEGHVLGTGTNGITSRFDPTAHAEVMAIRQAAERLGQADLSDCILYCSSEPTVIGQALIQSVEIGTVYYGLRHEEVSALRADDEKVRNKAKKVKYKQLCHDEAEEMVKKTQAPGAA